MSITEDAPAVAPPEQRPVALALRGMVVRWSRPASLLLVAVAAALTIAWLASRETRTTSYRVLGDLAGIRLDLGDADVEIDGGATAVEVRRVDRFAFGEPSVERRTKDGGRFSIVSRCPDQVLGDCRTVYRLTVPDNVPIEIETVERLGARSPACARRSRSAPARARSPRRRSAASRCARARSPAT